MGGPSASSASSSLSLAIGAQSNYVLEHILRPSIHPPLKQQVFGFVIELQWRATQTRRDSNASLCDHSRCASDCCMQRSTAQTSTTTNCMMSCNSQAASCQTRCFIPNVPGPPPSFSAPGSAGAVGPVFNSDANATCRMGCTSTQLSCQSGCALNSPSQ
jgi:hypothetical protein